MKGKLEGIARVPFNSIIERIEAPEGVTFREDTVGGISGQAGGDGEGSRSFTCTAGGSAGDQPGIPQPGGAHHPDSRSSNMLRDAEKVVLAGVRP